MEDVTIESLIAQKRVVTTADLSNPTADYMVVGVYQNGTNKSKGDGTSYKNYVISIAELLGGGSTTPIAPGVIPQGTGPSITNGKWAFSGNDIYPLAPCSNIGTPANRIQTIYMCSEIDYATDLIWKSTTERMRLTATGNLGIGIVPTSPLHVKGAGDYLGNPVFRVENLSNTAYATINDDGNMYINSVQYTGIQWQVGGAMATQIITTGVDTVKHRLPTDWTWVRKTDDFILGGKSGVNWYFQAAAATSITPTAKVHIQGESATNADFALKVDNLASSPLIYVRNDGNVGIGIATPSEKLHVNGVTRIEDAIYIQNDGYLTFSAGTNVSLMAINGRYLSLRSTASYVEIQTNGLTRMTVKASGTINADGLQVGNVGLLSGDLYVDSAANILANGDLVVGRKV